MYSAPLLPNAAPRTTLHLLSSGFSDLPVDLGGHGAVASVLSHIVAAVAGVVAVATMTIPRPATNTDLFRDSPSK